MVPRENKNNAYSKFGGTSKQYYGIFRSGLLIVTEQGRGLPKKVIYNLILSNSDTSPLQGVAKIVIYKDGRKIFGSSQGRGRANAYPRDRIL